MPNESETVIVIGIAPKNNRVLFFPGTLEAGKFTQNRLKTSPVSGAPTDGFLVGKVSAEDTLAITMVTVATKDDTIAFSKIFYVCGAGKTVVFKAPKGKVIYLGHLEYSSEQNTLRVKYGHDLDSAKAHLATNFPELAPALETYPFELLQVGQECPSTQPNFNTTYIQFVPPRK
jgi:hypothetical protein